MGGAEEPSPTSEPLLLPLKVAVTRLKEEEEEDIGTYASIAQVLVISGSQIPCPAN